MSKITINDILSESGLLASINSRFQQIENEFNQKLLYRDNPGSEANEMNNALDMNAYRILNLPMPVYAGEPARLQDLLDVYNGTTQHSYLLGLDADDHPQYLTEARGDLLYLPLAGPIDGASVTDNGTPRAIETALSYRPVMAESFAALMLMDLSGYTDAFTASFVAGQGRGGAQYIKDGVVTGTPSTAYADNSGFYDANGDGYILPSKDVFASQFGVNPTATADQNRDGLNNAVSFLFGIGGGVITLEEGIHEISNTAYTGVSAAGVMSILLRDNVHLQGTSHEAVIKLEDSAFGPGAYGRIITSLGDAGGEVGLTNSSVRNITIDGNSSNQIASTQYTNILLEAAVNVHVENVKSINSNGQGVMVRGQSAALAKNISVTRSTVDTCTGIGIQCSQFNGCSIVYNYVDNCANNAIDIYGDDGTTTSSTHNWVIADNVCRNSLTGVFPETVRDGIVANNTILSCTYGVHVNRINGDPENISIRNNNAQNCTIAYWHTGDNTMVVWAENQARNCTTGLKAGNTTGGNVAGIIAYNNIFQECTTALNITCNNGTYLKLFNNYGRGNTTWKSITVAGLSTSVIVDEESDFAGIYHPNAWRYLGTNSTANVVDVPVYFKDSGSSVREFGKIQWNSSTVTAGNKGSTLRFITKDANADVTSLELRQANVIMAALPTSSAGLPTGALWNNTGVVNVV